MLRVELLEDRSLLSFVAPLSYQVDIRPSNLAVGDFNGDGIPDLAVTNEDFGPGTLVIMLGNGDGTFRRGATYTMGNSPYSVAVGDFNGDGNLDLGVPNRLSHTISILLGNGDGTFRAGSTLGFDGDPYAVVAADLNRDGNLDLAAVGENNNGVGVFLGNGDGTFRAAQYYPTGNTPLSVAVGDFNGDGNLDLATGNSGTWPQYTGTVSVLLGNGDGSFQTHRDYVTGSGTHSVAVGDLTGDGTLDLVAANQRNQTISVLLGNGDGTFRYGDVYRTPPSPGAVVLADLNSDGRTEIVAANLYGNAVTVLLGNGDGTFRAPHDYLTGATPLAVVAADVNGDGRLDLVTANWGNDSITVLPGNGDGTFLTAVGSPAGTSPRFIVAGDFTHHGFPGLAVAELGAADANEPSSVSIVADQGDGTFRIVNTFPVGLGNLHFVTGDFNGDGNLDLAVIWDGNPAGQLYHNAGGLEVLLGNGDGTFQPPQTYMVGINPSTLVAADFNGDGRLDLIVATNGTHTLSILLGNGDGTFQAAQPLNIPQPPHVVAALDLNHDGIPDLVGLGPGVNISVLLGNGDGTFQPARTYDVGGSPSGLVAADFNGDGNLDLAVSVYLGPTYAAPGRVSVLRGNGDGTFQPAITFTTLALPADLAVGDFNGDGTLDLAVLTHPGLSVFLGNGDGSFQPGPTYATGNTVGLAVGNFTGGSLPDVVTVDQAVRVFRNAADWGTPADVPLRGRPRFISEGAVAQALPGDADRPLVWVVRMDHVSSQFVSAHDSLAAAVSPLRTWLPDEGVGDIRRSSRHTSWLRANTTEWPLRDDDRQDLLWSLLGGGGLV